MTTDEQNTEPQESAHRILEQLRDGGLWQPAGLGLTYIRTGDKTVTLSTQDNTPHSAQARIRMRMLIESVGWAVDESEVVIYDVAAQSPEEVRMQDMKLREVAQQWKCKCGTPLVAFPLEEGVWTFDGQEELLLPTGETEMAEQWSVVITCPVCKERIPCQPYDYGLLAGDDALVTYRGSNGTFYRVLTQDEIVELVDQKATSNVYILGTHCPIDGDHLPPHLRGSVVLTEVK